MKAMREKLDIGNVLGICRWNMFSTKVWNKIYRDGSEDVLHRIVMIIRSELMVPMSKKL